MATVKRNSATRKMYRDRIKRDEPACHICGTSIDYTLPHLDPMAFVIDHVVPLARGGADALSNIKAAHRRPRVQLEEESTPRGTYRSALRLARLTHGEDPPRHPPKPLWG